jgi:GTP-binding nuclear protein Ran
MSLPKRFKVVFIGDGEVGKTTFLNRHLTGDFTDKYIPTLGVDVHPLVFNTNYGQVILDVWDTAGQEKFGGLRDGYYIAADAALIFYDVNSKESCQGVGQWLYSFRNVTGPNTPVVLCGNKCDLRAKTKTKDMLLKHDSSLEEFMRYEISAKNNYNYEKPFLEVIRQLTGHEDLMFIINDTGNIKM